MKSKKTILNYKGGGFLKDVPARPLDQDDVSDLGRRGISERELINSGLYEPAKQQKPKPSKNKAVINPSKENKE